MKEKIEDMQKKKDCTNYSEMIARATEEIKAMVMDGETMLPLADGGVDYELEYRKQTGKDFVTGETVVQ